MKTRRIWIVIVVILVAGVMSTTYTKRYVEERESGPSMRIMAESGYGAAAAAPEETEMGNGGAADTAMPFAADAGPLSNLPQEAAADVPGVGTASEADSGISANAMPEAAGVPAGIEDSGEESTGSPQEAGADQAAAVSDTGREEAAAAGAAAAVPPQSAPLPNTPATLAQGAETAAAANQQEMLQENQTSVIVAGGGKDKLVISYKSRLEELDAQIEQNRKADAEKSVANSVKARAENELKLWEAELDGILKALEERLDKAQVEELYTKQREWRREKEAKALEASRKQNGSALEEVEFSVSLAESTRARAYELVEEYEAVLK